MSAALAPVSSWLIEPLGDEVSRSIARLAASEGVARVAVMPDVHLAGEVCVGVTVGTEHLLYPEAVGGDIGCGMAALCFDGEAAPLDATRAARLLAGFGDRIPVLRHPASSTRALPTALGDLRFTDPRLDRLLRREGTLELGTLGRGNHFLELQRGDEGRLWLMLHSGSRALGPAVRDHHLRGAQQGRTGLRHLDAEDDTGRAYLADVATALTWAERSRDEMLDAASSVVERVLGVRADESSRFACHHNHVRREEHGRSALWVHRKGAIPAAAGERGIIPGSMGAPSHHTEGRGHPDALGSSSHGAGRALPRGEARRRISLRDLSRQLDGIWFDHRLAEGLRDEAPAAYKDVRRVMRAQRDLTRVVRILEPLLVYKGG